MKKSNKILILFLVIFFVSLSSVSAMDNNAIITNDNQVVEDNPIQLAVSNTDDAILTGNQVTVSEGSSIQSAIDSADAGSTIIVQNGTYSEDIIVPKALSIVGDGAIIKSNNIAFNILSTANTTSISGFNIFVSNDEGAGIFVNASDCKITDNKISGGKVGILSEAHISIKGIEAYVINNISVIGNSISNCGESGISIKAFNPIISQNNVTNIVNKKGKAYGIHVGGIGVFSDFNVMVTDNYVSNIKSSSKSYGIDVWGLGIMDLVNFDTSGNIISNIVAPHKAVGMTNVVFSLDSDLPTVIVSDVNISDISSSGQEHGVATGLDLYVITIGQIEKTDAIIRDVQINNLDASGAKSSATGIMAIGVGCVDLYVLNNNLNNFKSSKSAKGIITIGIDFHDFKSFTSVSNNNITNFDASKIRGINVFSLGNAEINKNILYNLPGENSIFITGNALSFDFGRVFVPAPVSGSDDNLLGSSIIDNIVDDLPIDEIIEYINETLKKIEEKLINGSFIIIDGNLTMTGNNLEGTGIETGFAVLKPSTITYNRATNLKNNVVKESTRTFLLEALDINPDVPSKDLVYSFLKSLKISEKIPDGVIREISDKVGSIADRFFGDLDEVAAGDVDAKYNWWGTNSMPPASKFKNNEGTVLYDPWLTLRVNANPEVLGLGESSKITADVYMDSAGSDHSSDKFSFFNGPKVTFSTDKGSFDGNKSVTLDWVYGQASTYLKGDEVGLANVSAYDYDAAYTSVLILGNATPENETVENSSNVASAKTLPATGNPILLLFVVVMLFTSVGRYRKK